MRTLLSVGFALVLASAGAAQSVLDIRWLPNPVSDSNQLYRVYVSTNSTTVFALAGSTTGTIFSITNVGPGVYGASVTASNIWGETAKSQPVYTAGPVMVPSVPSGVSILIRVQ